MGERGTPGGRLIDDSRVAALVGELSDVALFELDLDGVCTAWEPMSAKYQAVPAASIVGASLEEFYPEGRDEQAGYRDDLAEAAELGRVERRGRWYGPDGACYWIHFVMIAKRDPQGRHTGFSGVVCDVTRERNSSIALQATEETLRILIDGLRDHAIYMLDTNGRVSNWNRGAESINGYRSDEVIGTHFSCFFSQQDQAAGEPDRALLIAREQGRYERQCWRLRKGGGRFRANIVIEPLHDSEDRLIGYGVVTRDITEKHRAAEELATAREALEQSEKLRSLGELTGGIAHDFNNLLTVVRGSAELLRRGNLTEEKRWRHLEAIIETADRAAELTGQLLSFARRQPLQPRPTDLNALIDEVTDLLRRTLGGGIAIEKVAEPGLWNVCVDPGQLQNLILNAAINARDAMDGAGTLTLATRNVPDDGAGGAVRLSISDTGTGMTAEVKARAFEPFFTTKMPGKGTGLGLSQAYGFAAQSGGRLEIDSEPGRGTTLNLYLPRAAAEPAARDSGRDDALPAGTRILLVEDSRTVAVFAKSLLEDMGCEIVHAATAEEALLALEDDADRFDIVFSDIVMPGLSGLDLAAKVRAQRPTLPILLATGYSEAAARGEGGEFPILPKPYRRETLSEMLGQTMNAVRRAA